MLRQADHRAILFLGKASLYFGNQIGQLNVDAFLLRVVLVQTHFLDLDLAGSELIFTDNDTKWNATVLGSLELLLRLGFGLVGELGLGKKISGGKSGG